MLEDLTMKTLIAAALAFAAILTGHALAEDYAAGDVHVADVWARATPGATPNGAAYMTLTVTGAEGDRLVAASSPSAKRAELHTHQMEGDVMKMRPVEAIEVAPGTPTVLEPGGLHVMLMGLAAPLKAGDHVPLSLTFEHAGTVEVEVEVKPLGEGMEMEHWDHDHGSHDMMDDS